MAVKDRGAGAQVEHAIHARLSNALRIINACIHDRAA
jgi:hypothetical protein